MAATTRYHDNMKYIVKAPAQLNVEISLPPSKSIYNRVLLMQRMIGQSLPIQPPHIADDTEVLFKALQSDADEVNIHGSGTAMRFLTAYYAASPNEAHMLTGTARMYARPIGQLVNALRSLGADIEYLDHEGFPPLCVRGRQLRGGETSMPGNVSSQFISALLMVAPLFDEGLTLHIEGPIISRSYIDLTLALMNDYGAQAGWSSVDTIRVEPRYGTQTPPSLLAPISDEDFNTTRRMWIESDWSAASYWYEIIALYNNPDARLTLYGLNDGSRQGDATVRHLFSLVGIKSRFMPPVETHLTPLQMHCTPTHMQQLNFHFINQPDLAPTFVVMCCLKGMHFQFTGLDSLRYKESNRLEALLTEMRKIGFVIEEDDNGTLKWDGQRCEGMEQPVINTYEDHRMAMSFAPAAITLGSIIIDSPEVVDKSYPQYWTDLEKAGFTITPINA